jgi:transposase, IS5 family
VSVEPHSTDTDATWLKKGKKSHYGYRRYVTFDEENYVRGIHSAPANESEVGHLETADIEAARILADNGYGSAANRNHLKQRQKKSGIKHLCPWVQGGAYVTDR